MSALQITEDMAQYVAEVEAWRKRVEDDLRAPDGWLSLTGLYELKEGEQIAGSAESSDVVLPGSTPAQLGAITFQDGKVHLSVTADAPVLVDGAPARQAELIEDGDGTRTPTKVTLGSVTFFVHSYGDKRAIRVKDSNNPAIRDFKGRRWFEVKPEYRVRGRYVPYDAPRTLQVGSITNDPLELTSTGEVELELHGQPVRLIALGAGQPLPARVWVLFRDTTAGKQTYPALRSLVISIDADGVADVDFNKAQNMPCAFTPYATCPLPPRQNILAIPVEAGELYDGDHA